MEKKKKLRVVIAVIAVLACGVIYLAANSRDDPGGVVTERLAGEAGSAGTATKATGVPEEEEKSRDGTTVYVHICGEVKKPGVYTYASPPRLVDVVKSAGGFTKKADRSAVNLAESAMDGSKVTIPSRQGKKPAGAEPAGGGSGRPSDGKVNINTASREELMTLSGIGESKASQIIAYREANGLFKKIDDIMNISGIKEGVFGKIKDHIIVS